MKSVKKLLLTLCICGTVGYIACISSSNQTVTNVNLLAKPSNTQEITYNLRVNNSVPISSDVVVATDSQATEVNTVTPTFQDAKLTQLGEEILKGISSYSDSFSVSSSNTDDIMNQVDLIRRTNPLVGYNITGYHISFTTSSSGMSSGMSTAMKVTYVNNKENMDKLIVELQNILSEIIEPEMTTLEKVKEIHDYIINNTEYDTTYVIHDAYNTLLTGKGVCEGYAVLLNEMLSLSGIESKVVSGTGNGGNHAWNLVNIDGHWGHVDATWDDPLTSNGRDILRYDYFNISEEEISKDHVWETSQYPKAE